MPLLQQAVEIRTTLSISPLFFTYVPLKRTSFCFSIQLLLRDQCDCSKLLLNFVEVYQGSLSSNIMTQVPIVLYPLCYYCGQKKHQLLLALSFRHHLACNFLGVVPRDKHFLPHPCRLVSGQTNDLQPSPSIAGPFIFWTASSFLMFCLITVINNCTKLFLFKFSF